MSRDELRHLEHGNLTFAVEYGLERVVGIDHRSFFLILTTVLLDVIPELFGKLRSRERFGTDDSRKLFVGLDGPHERGVRFTFRGSLFGFGFGHRSFLELLIHLGKLKFHQARKR